MANTIEIYVDFIEYQLPGLKSGNYTVEVEQTLSAPGVSEPPFKSQEKDFSVRGERFRLKPADIASVFPPPGSLGEHSSVFPQVVFERNTLPWERTIVPEEEAVEKMPWMALLVFDEGDLYGKDDQATRADIEQGHIMKVSEFKALPFSNGAALKKETGENEEQKISVIFAKKRLLQQQLPTGKGLSLLTHARESSLRVQLDNPPADRLVYEIWDPKKDQLLHAASIGIEKGRAQQVVLNPGRLTTGVYSLKLRVDTLKLEESIEISPNDEFGHKVAVVVAGRLPRPGARSIVHLVSLEKRYHQIGKDFVFNFGEAADEQLIPLVSLKSWSFYCTTPRYNFDELLRKVITTKQEAVYASDALNAGVSAFNTLRLPRRPNPGNGDPDIQAANLYLENGYVPLTHHFRFGGNSISWYRSPLLPGRKTASSLPDGLFPASCADELMFYDGTNGLFDASYAAAWELGRLLLLCNRSIAGSLYRWKATHRTRLLLAGQQERYAHLPFQHPATASIDLPPDMEIWFSRLRLLQGLPFNYLVPDERMLPAESIGFFHLDPDWVACLVDGAFSVGRITGRDEEHDRHLHRRTLTKENLPPVSGFLLRSFVVKGWPHLQVEGYSAIAAEAEMDAKKLKLLRMDRLSANVLICLFEGEIAVVDISQRPEMLHWGFKIPAPTNPQQYTKALRNAAGGASVEESLSDQSWDRPNRVVNVEKLFQDIERKKNTLGFTNGFSAAQFALTMVAGVQKVRFTVK